MDTIKNYAFISYKRKQKDGRFKNDEYWADQIHKKLTEWSIPSLDPALLKLNNYHTIRPVIRDKRSFLPGYDLNKTIKDAILQSNSFILVLSKAMKDNQEELIKNGDKEAYVYKELNYFLSLDRPSNPLIVVYIDEDEYIPEVCLPSIIKKTKKESNIPVIINEYNDLEDKEKHVAGAIAAALFGVNNKEVFISVYDEGKRQERRQRMKEKFYIVAVAIFVIL